MNERDEFEKWFNSSPWQDFDDDQRNYQTARGSWQACAAMEER